VADIDDIDAFTVPLFCARHSISRATFYNLFYRDEAPTIMKVGSRILISRESAELWRRQREADTAARGLGPRRKTAAT